MKKQTSFTEKLASIPQLYEMTKKVIEAEVREKSNPQKDQLLTTSTPRKIPCTNLEGILEYTQTWDDMDCFDFEPCYRFTWGESGEKHQDKYEFLADFSDNHLWSEGSNIAILRAVFLIECRVADKETPKRFALWQYPDHVNETIEELASDPDNWEGRDARIVSRYKSSNIIFVFDFETGGFMFDAKKETQLSTIIKKAYKLHELWEDWDKDEILNPEIDIFHKHDLNTIILNENWGVLEIQCATLDWTD